MEGFFQVVTRREFHARLAEFPPTPVEIVTLDEALGRTLAEDVVSPQDLPLCDRSSMDGYAVAARDSFGAGEANPAYLECVAEIRVDSVCERELQPGECARIPTGGSLCPGADAVVMSEHTQKMGGGTVEIRCSVVPGENVVRRGEDVAEGAVALPRGRCVRPQEMGLLAALGVREMAAHSRPRVAIISTGDEVTPVEAPAQPGKVRDVNAHAVRAMVLQAGALPTLLGIAPDDQAELIALLRHALDEHDAVFLSGGSSVGARDITIAALEAMGDADILIHGLNIKPGKPTILARRGHAPILGLPGQVTSAQVVMLLVGVPLIRHLQADARAFADRRNPGLRARLARNIASRQGREDFVRVVLEEKEGDLPLARPVLGASGMLRTLVASHGLVPVPAEAEGLYAGQEVDVWLI